MSRFNTASQASVPDTYNEAGGAAFSLSDEAKFATMVLTSKLKDGYYKSAGSQLNDIKNLVGKLDPKYVAQTAVYARNTYGLRTISHVIAGEIGKKVKGADWTKNFFGSVIRRVDDMFETLGYYSSINGGKVKPIPNSMKKGFKKAFSKFDGYQLAKYKAEGKEINLLDTVNLVHPVPNDKNRDGLNKLVVDNSLKNTKTWEAKSSAAGKEAKTEEQKVEAKKAVWSGMTKEKNRPYLETIKNINNVLKNSPESMDDLCLQLTNKAAIQKSLVMPFEIVKAYEASKELTTKMKSAEADKLVDALNQAFRHAVDNILLPEGETLVALDKSGSMMVGYGNTEGGAIAVALPLTVAISIARTGDTILFDDNPKVVNADGARRMEPLQAMDYIKGKVGQPNGTDFSCIFKNLDKKYDNIVILSDMQSWGSGGASGTTGALREYEKRTGARPSVFLIDVVGLGTAQFPTHRVATIAGFTRETLSLLGKVIKDPNALVNEIKQVKFD